MIFFFGGKKRRRRKRCCGYFFFFLVFKKITSFKCGATRLTITRAVALILNPSIPCFCLLLFTSFKCGVTRPTRAIALSSIKKEGKGEEEEGGAKRMGSREVTKGTRKGNLLELID